MRVILSETSEIPNGGSEVGGVEAEFGEKCHESENLHGFRPYCGKSSVSIYSQRGILRLNGWRVEQAGENFPRSFGCVMGEGRGFGVSVGESMAFGGALLLLWGMK